MARDFDARSEQLRSLYEGVVSDYRSGEDLRALEGLRRLERMAPPDTFHRRHVFYFKTTIVGFRQKRYAQGLKLARRGTAAFPDYRDLWFLQGRLLTELGRPAAALAAFIRAQRLQAQAPTACEIAKILHRAGRATMAVKTARWAIDLGASEPVLRAIAAGAPSPVRARRLSARALARRSKAEAGIRLAYEEMLAAYNRGDDAAALESVRRLERIAPRETFHRRHGLYFKTTIVGFRQKRYAEALKLAQRGATAFPDYRDLWFLQGRLLTELGRPTAALRAFIRAQRLEAQAPTACEIAKILHRAGHRAMAVKTARWAIDLGAEKSLLDPILVGSRPVASAPALFSQWKPFAGAKMAAGPDGPCQGVILVLGNAYCGSTLLNILLGAHPAIAGGGELHWLVHADAQQRAQEGRCVFCREACQVWTAQARAQVTPETLYDMTASVFGRPFVCDASKMSDWSSFIAPASPARTLRVLMTKHPLRHVASFLEKARRVGPKDLASVGPVLAHLSKIYDHILAEPIDVVLRYEDLVADPRVAMTPILKRLGLDWDPAIDDWRTAPHHHIGGNAGPRSQITPASRPTGGLLQRKYNRGDIFLDDSFATVLTSRDIHSVTSHPLAKSLCKRFGYDTNIQPKTDREFLSMSVTGGRRSLRNAPQPLYPPFEYSGGHCYVARMELTPQHRFIHSIADREEDHTRSQLKLLEDGRPLGPPHTIGAEIRANGQGRYHHWKEILLFSASDNSDPNGNGRKYSLSL